MIEKKTHTNGIYVLDRHLGGFISAQNGDSGTFDPDVWNYLFETFKPSSVVDVGCGEGHVLDYFKKLNVKTILGVDGCRAVYDQSPVPEDIMIVDFTRGGFIPNDIFDLAWSCEFVEHVEEKFIKNYFSIFEKSKFVAMTHAIEGQDGHNHVNCKNEQYWIDLFEKNNFEYLINETDIARKLSSAAYVKPTLKIFKNLKW